MLDDRDPPITKEGLVMRKSRAGSPILRTIMPCLVHGLLLFPLLAVGADSAQRIDPEQAEKIVETYYQKKGLSPESIAHRKLAARTAVSLMEKVGTAALSSVERARINNQQPSSAAEAALIQYQKRKAEIAIDYAIVDTVNALGKGAALLLTVDMPIAAPILALTWQNTNDRLIQWTRDTEDENNRIAFVLAFNQLGDDFIKGLKRLPPQQIPTAIENKIAEVRLLDSAPPEIRETMAASFHTLALSVGAYNAEALVQQGAELQKQGKTIQRQGESIHKIDQALDQHVHATAQRFEEIGHQVQALKSSVEILGKQTGQNTQDIAYMQGLLWNRLSVDEQLSAVQSGGFFREMTPAERQAQVAELKAQKAREDLIDSVDDTLNAAGTFIDAARTLGVPAETLKPLAQGLEAGDALFSVAVAAGSGNPVAILNAVTSLTGLFGGNQPDPNAIRHQEIMDKLRKIEGLQEETLDEIRIVQAQLRNVLALQVETLRQIAVLSQDLNSIHQSLITKIEEVNANVLENIKITTDVATQGVDQCRISMSTDRDNFHIRDLSIASYDELLPWLSYTAPAAPAPGVALCTTWLLWTLERKAGDWYFRVRNPVNPETPLTGTGDGLRRVYQPLWSRFQGLTDAANKPIRLEPALAGLMSSSTSVSLLDAKWDAARGAKLSVPCHVTLSVNEKASGARCGDESPQHSTVAEYLMYPYYLRPIDEAVQYALEMHVFPAYYQNRTPLPLNKMTMPNPDGLKDGMKILKNMLRRLDVAIAQRNLLHGDLLIPDLYRQFNEASNQLKTSGLTDQQRIETQIKLLDTSLLLDRAALAPVNPDFQILATNFLLYTLVKDFAKNGGNDLQYQAVTQFNNLDAWKQYVSSPLELVYAATDGEEREFEVVKLDPRTQQPVLNLKTGYELEKVKLKAPKGWSTRFNRTFVRMPSLIVFKQKALIVPQDVRYLMRLRESVFEELASYGILTNQFFTPNQLTLIQDALFSEAVVVRAEKKSIANSEFSY